MRRTFNSILFLCVFILMGTASLTYAGLIITEVDGGKVVVSKGKLKSVSPDDPHVTVLDANSGTLTVMDMSKKTYASGTVDEFCKGFKNSLQKVMEGIPPEQRKMMEQYMAQMKQQGGGVESVRVARSGKGKKVAGYETVRFTVTRNGELYEEHYVTSDRSLLKEFGDFAKFSRTFSRMEACLSDAMSGVPTNAPETSPEYRKISEAGYTLLVVNYSTGTPRVEEEVVKIEKKSIPPSEFLPPEGFREVSFSEMIEFERE